MTRYAFIIDDKIIGTTMFEELPDNILETIRKDYAERQELPKWKHVTIVPFGSLRLHKRSKVLRMLAEENIAFSHFEHACLKANMTMEEVRSADSSACTVSIRRKIAKELAGMGLKYKVIGYTLNRSPAQIGHYVRCK